MRALPVVSSPVSKDQEKDPVCGMTVSIATAAGSFEHEGRKYYFCSQHCLDRFRENPAAFLFDSAKPAAPASRNRVEYTCPMHPEIVRDRPGSCPICGMALEPRTITAAGGENPELTDMTRRLWVSVFLTLPVFLLGMNDLLPGRPFERLASMDTL